MKVEIVGNRGSHNYPLGGIINLPNDKIEYWIQRGSLDNLSLDFDDPRNDRFYPKFSRQNFAGNN